MTDLSAASTNSYGSDPANNPFITPQPLPPPQPTQGQPAVTPESYSDEQIDQISHDSSYDITPRQQHSVESSHSSSQPHVSIASTSHNDDSLKQPSHDSSTYTTQNSIQEQPFAPVATEKRTQGSKVSSSDTTGVIMAQRSADEEMEDGRIRNREAVTKIRDAWIYKQIQARQGEFTQYNQGRIFLGTWNVNAKEQDNLDDWLCSDWGPNGEHSPDIIAVGLQEMVDLNAVNVAVDNKSQQRSQVWAEQIRHTINAKKYTNGDPMRTYSFLCDKHLVGLLLCVFVKAPHKPRVKHVHSDSVGVGVMGMMGNKGGVGIRIQFYDSTICIVNSHLAAHRENIAGRNADFANVYTKMSFDIGDEAVKEVIRSGSLSQWASGSSSMGISAHDIVFWIGDLNYRVDESIPTDRVIELSKKGELDELIVNDQLNIERAEGRVFQGFDEGPLTFIPTYKYQPGTDHFESRADKKLRAPAWCDRVLWSAQEPGHVTQLSYSRSELNASDHKPVMSTFVVTIKNVVQSKREEVYDEVMKLLDKYENQSLPMVGLDRLNLDFGEVHYDQTVTLPIKVTNTGKVVAQFRLVPKLDEVTLCKPWMTVSPTYGMLIPGEEEATIQFSITIDNATAQALNAGREVLEDILILRLENGRDYYITVKGKYARSCFGMSVDELVMYSQPIRHVPLCPIKRAETADTTPSAALCVPKELWRIVDAIYEKGLHEKDLFTAPGNPEAIYEIRECLDTGDSFGEFSIHSMTDIMLSFLSNLSAPIVPTNLFPNLEIDAQNLQSFCRKFLEELPPIHYNVFVYIISFFRECLLYRESNKLSAAKLARICTNCLVKGSAQGNIVDGASPIQRLAAMQLIVLHFLETNSI